MLSLKNLFGKKSDEAEVNVPQQNQKSGVAGAVSKLFDKNEKEVARLRPVVEKIALLGPELKELTDEELKNRSLELKQKFRDEVTTRLQKRRDAETNEPYEFLELESALEWSDDYNRARRDAEKEVLDVLLPEAFALVREAGDRTIGLRHFDVQMIGGAVLHSGRIAEMRTGEGKTLVATSPVYLNALSGRGVHVITVNDYLAERDANWMRPIYEFLGLSVAFLTNEMEPDARQAAYASDVLYATNSEVGFDYLRDNMARSPEEMVQRPLNFAMVDEVDNILIDEARTPLIISAQVAKTDRALRRQAMAKTCDGVARTLTPAVTEREVEALLDSLTTKGRLDIAALLDFILKRGAFTTATQYLIDAYLVSEKSARTENAGALLQVSDELFEAGLIDADGRATLEALSINAVRPAGLRAAWEKEAARLTEPFARAYAQASVETEPHAIANALADNLALPEDEAAEIAAQLEEEDHRAVILTVVTDEMARRGLIEQSAAELVTAELQSIELPSVEADAPRKNEAPEAVEARRRDKAAQHGLATVHPVLLASALQSPGALQEADALLNESVPDVDGTLNPEQVRGVIGALEQISLRALLPFDSLEHLWESVRLAQGRNALKAEIVGAIQKHPGDAARKISDFVAAYRDEREAFLKSEAQTLRGQLSGHEAVANRAQSGEDVASLRRALLQELSKNGAFAQASKAARAFVAEQAKAHGEIAENLAEEMAVYVEVPRDARKTLAALLSEGGKPETVRERLMLAVRDLPGENTELPALVTESVRQLSAWRGESAENLLAQIEGAGVQLPSEAQEALRTAIEDGEYSAGFEAFAGEQLLMAQDVAPLTQAIESFGDKWDEFKAQSSARLLENLEGALELSLDAREAVEDLVAKPLSGALDAAIFGELASDAVSRHLEPLLTDENAPAFAEEIKRRIPLAKDIQKALKPREFAGRSSEQLERALVRLVERSFQAMPFEDFKRVVINLGAFAEKDEKRRTAALTDMGTLVAEREAGTSAFTDPDNLLDTLLAGEILTEEEAAIVRRAQADTPETGLSSVIDRTLRLPAERRRRLSESKLQEVQPVLDQSVKAHALFAREVNYVIDSSEGKREIVIVDEFTGRKMPGRRFNDGLHEALEAKHGLEVQLESQTVATITIQNYFRLYNKLGGMTGTAKTEEAEFAKTYGIEVVSIPTNRPISRRDSPDVVYKTAEAKMRAATFEILEHHCSGQPVLVGTRSVEVSERMAERLKPQALQILVLSHLCKEKLRETKESGMSEEQQAEVMELLRAPIVPPTAEEAHRLKSAGRRPEPPALPQVKAVAKMLGVQPDAAQDDNLNTLLGLFTTPNPSRERLATALRVGLPHNVLNAKNHRNEARIIAEAARPAAVTIATNMAGRGVDIVLGGTLDVESRWRVMTLQTLARHLEGKAVHVRARNQEATDKLVDRLQPERLQDLAWTLGVSQAVEELQKSGGLEGQTAKEIREALGQELTTPDLKNKVRSRARRLGLVEKLPLDVEPLDSAPIEAMLREIERLMNRRFDANLLNQTLQIGIATQATGRDIGESVVLQALAVPLNMAQEATGKLLETLSDLPDLDRALLQAASETQDAQQLAETVGNVTPEWTAARLQALKVSDASSAQSQLATLPQSEIEISEMQLAVALEDGNLGTQWLRERLNGWQLVKDGRAFEATEEMQQVLGDTAVVHYRFDQARAQTLWQDWQSNADLKREMTMVEVPNVLLLGDMAQIAGGNAPFLDPEWLHNALVQLGIVRDQNDVMQAQMMAEGQDETGNIVPVPIDVLVYRVQLPRVLEQLDVTLREAVAKSGNDANAVFAHLGHAAPWAAPFVDALWVDNRLKGLGEMEQVALTPGQAAVLIETGVAGQSADIVLESEPRPEEIAHTSEQEAVKALGGLHILGTERHESRRIDNQLRGRAGRQGDPGSSRFYVSLEDELWRLFGVRGQWLLNKWDEEEAVEASMISKSIERAQKKVELNHFESRKHVLQYDDVMNVQREVIYRERRRALMGGDLRDTVLDMAQQAALAESEKHCPVAVRPEEWDAHRLYTGLGRLLGASLVMKQIKSDELEAMRSREEIDERVREVVEACYQGREAEIGDETMRGLERWQLTRSIDEHWMEHLAEMDYLRDAIWQEGYAQKEPIGVYRQEGYALFQKMLGEIRREVTEAIFSTPVEDQSAPEFYGGPQLLDLQEARFLQELPMDIEGQGDDGAMLEKDADAYPEDEPVVMSQRGASPILHAPQTMMQPLVPAKTNGASQASTHESQPRVSGQQGSAKIGRNDPCWCGSGKKYKKCHLNQDQGMTV